MTTNIGLVVKSNQLIEAAYRLSLTEQRLIAYAIARAMEEEKGLQGNHLRITVKQYATAFNLEESGSVYTELKEALNALFNRLLTIKDSDEESGCERVSKVRWLSRASYIDGAGVVQLMFGQDMVRHITRLESEFTSYRLDKVIGLTSAHAFRLYELLAQYLNLGRREIKIEWMKNVMQVDGSYDRLDRLKACVIDPAIKQINERTDIVVSYTQKKSGRIVTHLIFDIKKKPEPKVKKEYKAPAALALPKEVTDAAKIGRNIHSPITVAGLAAIRAALIMK